MRRLDARGLTPVLTLAHLAHLTGVHYLYLREIVQRRRDPYTEFSRPKRETGKTRTIAAPDPVLMNVQRWLLHQIFGRLTPHQASYAYQQGRSAVQCAQRHLGATWLLKFDLHNFFPSINERAVQAVVHAAGYNKLISFEIARLCTRVPWVVEWPYSGSSYQTIDTYRTPRVGRLPQGAPTSGALANVVARPLDETLAALAEHYDLTYTRYADDMTFSTFRRFERPTLTRCVAEITQAVAATPFTLHRKKTRVVPPGARKIVLGLLVDGDEVRLPRQTRKRLEDHIRGAEKFGFAAHVEHIGFSSLQGFIHHVDGLLAYAQGVDTAWARPLTRQWEDLLAAEGFSVLERRRW
ncbi:reverse transcriptase family protein [Streptomyces sp. V4I2]|uniref:reverse transcriptase family protein n=1 Tax=Streptomyces sp. V4I2 TaxID=3042280 RepID=UPI0027830BA1|nr:reverse transcriptase family protein [Streptomyces sp. V4I2]MDQ1045057.1 RNA-directed DNA polymerase [Streptomyces sp. V4I2]